MGVPEPEIVDDRFEWQGEYIDCFQWFCPKCEETNCAPAYHLAENVYIRHYRDEHPELTLG